MASRVDDMFVTLEDTTVSSGILIGIAENFFHVPVNANKYEEISGTVSRWTYLNRKPTLGTIAVNLALVRELRTDVVFTFDNERWQVKIHRDLYEDIVGIERVPDAATDWTVYSSDPSNASKLVTTRVESVEDIDTKVVENLPPETPEPSAQVDTEEVLSTETNGIKTVESNFPNIDGIPTSSR